MPPINVSEYEALARERMDAKHWDYFMGGSGDELTIRTNRSAFAQLQLRPRMLVDVSNCDPPSRRAWSTDHSETVPMLGNGLSEIAPTVATTLMVSPE